MGDKRVDVDHAAGLMREAEDRPWLNGRPYYCSTCGAPRSEIKDCEFVDESPPQCVLETEEEARTRTDRFLRERSRGR